MMLNSPSKTADLLASNLRIIRILNRPDAGAPGVLKFFFQRTGEGRGPRAQIYTPIAKALASVTRGNTTCEDSRLVPSPHMRCDLFGQPITIASLSP